MKKTEKRCRVCRHFNKGYCDLLELLIRVEKEPIAPQDEINNPKNGIKGFRAKIINYDTFYCSEFE